MIKVILWDIDATLLDFDMAEHAAFYKCFEVLGLEGCGEELLGRYSAINRRYWERLEKNEITKQEVLVGRFLELFTKEQITAEGKSTLELAEQFNEEYQLRLGDTVCFCDHGYDLVTELKEAGMKQYAVTNGTAVAQHKKLTNAKLKEVLDGYFISDELGVEKPNVAFFDKVWETIGVYDKREVIIIGDSLTSDMQGGKNAGIRCCWYNPKAKPNTSNLQLDYEIKNLWEIKNILTNEV